MNIHFYTLGCKVNQYESQAIREGFIKKGYENNDDAAADIIIINSCTVTAQSDKKTRQLVRKCRRENSNAIIVLTGCMVQAFPQKAAELIEADIIVGNTDVIKILSSVEDYIFSREKINIVNPHLNGELYNTPSINTFSERTRAYMKIEDGCDRFCSYCIIPTARGRVRSRSLNSIIAEASSLAENGYSEIVLVGINLSAYGKEQEFDLCDAVDAVSSINGIKRVRLGSLEPDHISDEMLLRFKAQEKFCPQFHLSLQSGCDQTLKRMNRHYDSAFYYDLVSRIRKNFEDAAITTDIMVGFAGESEEEFNSSLSFVKKIGFSRAHIFVYSKRSGTIAAALKNQVSDSDKNHRANLMADVTSKSENAFMYSQCGKHFPVLFETAQNGIIEGYTPNYTRVAVKSKKPRTGEILTVKITGIKDNMCIGELI